MWWSDRERSSCSADDHHATGEPDSDGGTSSELLGSCSRNGAAELPVAEEWGEYRGSDLQQLHNSSHHHFRQRIDVRRGGNEHGRHGDERGGDTDGERSSHSADDHYAAGESNGDRGTNSELVGSGSRDRAAKLPVAEERGEHRGSDLQQLHDAGHIDLG